MNFPLILLRIYFKQKKNFNSKIKLCKECYYTSTKRRKLNQLDKIELFRINYISKINFEREKKKRY